jgi:hypothetical protein
MENLYMSKSNLITDKVEINLNMLRALMLDGVAGHVDGADVVTENHRSSAERGVEFQEELAEPGSLGHSIGDCTVLGLGARVGDRRLAFGGPGYKVGAEEHCISRCGFASVGAANPVGIRVDDKILNAGRAQMQAQVQRALNIAKNPLQSNQMNVPRSVHVKADLLNRISNVRTSEGEVLKSTC